MIIKNNGSIQKETTLNQSPREGENLLLVGWGVDENLANLFINNKIVTSPQINLSKLLKQFQANSTLGLPKLNEMEKGVFYELFSRFKEVYPNFDKVYDKELNFLNITDISSIEKKAELTEEMQNLLEPILEKKMSNSTEKPGIIKYILEAVGQLFNNIILSPDSKENNMFTILKNKFPQLSKNWNWLLHYQEVIILNTL